MIQQSEQDIFLKNNLGQSLIEFMLLLIVIVVLALFLQRFINTAIANLWINVIKRLASNPSSISIP